ncbi:YtoQ family protein [Metabacillus sp. KIGAM252]|uniref:YtoQ family protein n=1 Tax=Metabacillus flavus TaxID=2823519 RepID=A0ABS5LH38_9BACI|nr:YtoQ family protein [Metabacillus flavus]MBS2970060.1 YtoQ family protein [Metabacillus flavus]
MNLHIFLAGEIHSDWRTELKEKAAHLPITFTSPMENHERSDQIGEEILGKQADSIQKDEAASRINNLRTSLLLKKADLVISLFGESYKQWNTAMDASAAIEMGKPLILIRPRELHHPLKELSSKASVTVETVSQAIQILSYIYDKE